MRGVEVVYHDVILVLRGVSLEVADGQIVALLGANGAGKTTLLHAVSGLLPVHRGEITKGSVELHGQPIAGLDAPAIVRRGVAQVMEGRRTFFELTVDENLRAGGFARRGDKKAAKDAHERVLDLFPVLRERNKSIAGYLSGGEQQMLAMGRALMASPKVLLLDEPSLGLAPLVVERIFEVLQTLRARGMTMLLVEQRAEAALELADYAYVLAVGRVVAEGRAKDLKGDPRITQSYLGETNAMAAR